MALRTPELVRQIDRLEAQLVRLRAPAVAPAIERVRSDLAAARFHASARAGDRPIIAVIGGTGTGKSTLVNRLLETDVTAASFRRTFTAGPIAIVRKKADLPGEWLGVPHETPTERPARGTIGQLLVLPLDAALTQSITIVDTPDLDGDQPAHHAQAERVFRWANGVLFLVTPEKYQMTELPPYYRLAARYGVPAWFVMNKCESREQLDDYRRQLGDIAQGRLFAIPRDDSVFVPEAGESLQALRDALKDGCLTPSPGTPGEGGGEGSAALANRSTSQQNPHPALSRSTGRGFSQAGLENRIADMIDRLADQVVSPLTRGRRTADDLTAALRSLSVPAASVDVNPVTRQLQKRMQERSVLYLMGPGRIVDRMRQVPSLLARLPRATWDWATGRNEPTNGSAAALPAAGAVPDFAGLLADQLAILHSRVDDVLRSNPQSAEWIARDETAYKASQLPTIVARVVADEELAELKAWLEQRWNATPRDTRILQAMIKYLPGGAQLTKWSEAAPYLLTIVVAAHHAMFGHIDLLILGGYSLTAWLTERISNEVSSRTRQTNRQIAERFADLAEQQVSQYVAWIESQCASASEIAALQQYIEELSTTDEHR